MKNYLVIGGSSGIGKTLSYLLSDQGYNVYASYNQTTTVDSHPNVHYFKLNVIEKDPDLSHLPETLDGLVYCPGSINLVPFKRLKPEDFLADFELQVNGAIKVIQAVLKNLKKGTFPSIVLFSTVAVQQGFNFHTQVAVSKGAIEGLTRSLAAEFSPQIRVNAIAPSLTDTPLAEKLLGTDQKREANAQRHPLKTIGEPEDIAETASFLLSEKAKWITGQIIAVDGGMSRLKT